MFQGRGYAWFQALFWTLLTLWWAILIGMNREPVWTMYVACMALFADLNLLRRIADKS